VERPLEQRIEALDWDALSGALLEDGFAVVERLLTDAECDALIALYGQDALFRSTIDMQRFNFGRGEYRYFNYPLPGLVQLLREAIYGRIAQAANAWSTRLRQGVTYPQRFSAFQDALRGRGQTKPTPLLLRYGKGDFNNLHQDINGDLVFPYQVTFGLTEKGKDYQGGQLILTQQRPRMQTVPHVITIPKGGGVIFASNLHAQQGRKGFYRSIFRHGVSRIEDGSRYTLGVVFHDFRG
jgi:hypothetical protein